MRGTYMLAGTIDELKAKVQETADKLGVSKYLGPIIDDSDPPSGIPIAVPAAAPQPAEDSFPWTWIAIGAGALFLLPRFLK